MASMIFLDATFQALTEDASPVPHGAYDDTRRVV
jgi:hypothetical protein